MDGGQVNLQTLKIPDNIKYRFDCVWQIKSPQKKGTFGVYARVVSMNLEHGEPIFSLVTHAHALGWPTEFLSESTGTHIPTCD